MSYFGRYDNIGIIDSGVISPGVETFDEELLKASGGGAGSSTDLADVAGEGIKNESVLSSLNIVLIVITSLALIALVVFIILFVKLKRSPIENKNVPMTPIEEEQGLTKIKQDISGIDQELTAKTSELEEKKQKLAKINQDISGINQELTAKTSELNEKARELNEKKQKLTKIKQDISGIDQELTAKTSELSKKQQELNEKNQESKKINQDISGIDQKLTAQASELEEKKQKSKKINQDISGIDQELKAKTQALSKKQQELKEKEQESKKIDHDISGIDQELTAKTSELSKKQQELNEKNQESKKINQDISGIDQKLTAQASELEEKKQKSKKINQDISKTEQELTKKTQALNEKEQESKKIDHDILKIEKKSTKIATKIDSENVVFGINEQKAALEKQNVALRGEIDNFFVILNVVDNLKIDSTSGENAVREEIGKIVTNLEHFFVGQTQNSVAPFIKSTVKKIKTLSDTDKFSNNEMNYARELLEKFKKQAGAYCNSFYEIWLDGISKIITKEGSSEKHAHTYIMNKFLALRPFLQGSVNGTLIVLPNKFRNLSRSIAKLASVPSEVFVQQEYVENEINKLFEENTSEKDTSMNDANTSILRNALEKEKKFLVELAKNEQKEMTNGQVNEDAFLNVVGKVLDSVISLEKGERKVFNMQKILREYSIIINNINRYIDNGKIYGSAAQARKYAQKFLAKIKNGTLFSNGELENTESELGKAINDIQILVNSPDEDNLYQKISRAFGEFNKYADSGFKATFEKQIADCMKADMQHLSKIFEKIGRRTSGTEKPDILNPINHLGPKLLYKIFKKLELSVQYYSEDYTDKWWLNGNWIGDKWKGLIGNMMKQYGNFVDTDPSKYSEEQRNILKNIVAKCYARVVYKYSDDELKAFDQSVDKRFADSSKTQSSKSMELHGNNPKACKPSTLMSASRTRQENYYGGYGGYGFWPH